MVTQFREQRGKKIESNTFCGRKRTNGNARYGTASTDFFFSQYKCPGNPRQTLQTAQNAYSNCLSVPYKKSSGHCMHLSFAFSVSQLVHLLLTFSTLPISTTHYVPSLSHYSISPSSFKRHSFRHQVKFFSDCTMKQLYLTQPFFSFQCFTNCSLRITYIRRTSNTR